MKRMKRIGGASQVLFAALLAAGCSEKSDRLPAPAAATNAPATNGTAEKSTMQAFIEGATGKTAVDAGRAAQDKIRKISSEHNKDLDEVQQ